MSIEARLDIPCGEMSLQAVGKLGIERHLMIGVWLDTSQIPAAQGMSPNALRAEALVGDRRTVARASWRRPTALQGLAHRGLFSATRVAQVHTRRARP